MLRVILIGISAFFALLLRIPAAISAIKTNMEARKRARITRRLRELETEKQQNEDKKVRDEKVKSASEDDIDKHFGSNKF